MKSIGDGNFQFDLKATSKGQYFKIKIGNFLFEFYLFFNVVIPQEANGVNCFACDVEKFKSRSYFYVSHFFIF